MDNSERAYRRMFNAWSAGKYAVALDLSRRFVQEFPSDQYGCVLRGVILYEMCRYREAERVLRRALRIMPSNCLHYGYAHFGHLHRDPGDYQKAARWYHKVKAQPLGRACGLLYLGEMFVRKGDLRSAATLLRERHLRHSREAHFNLGRVYCGERKYKQAIKSFDRALALNPDRREAILARRDVEKAIAFLAQGTAKRPANHAQPRPREWRRLSTELFDAHEKDSFCCTLEFSRRLLDWFPNFDLGWVYYGHSLYSVGRYTEATRALQRALRLVPKARHLILAELGHMYRRRGNFRRAEFWYRRGIESRPSRSGAHIYLGALLAEAGRLREAEATHRKAARCREGPTDEAYLNLGYVLRAQERFEEALQCFEKALKITPNYKHAKKAAADVSEALRRRRSEDG